MNTAYVPPSYDPSLPPQRGRSNTGGCWLWGCVSCVVVVIIVAIVFAVTVHSVVKGLPGSFRRSLEDWQRSMQGDPQCTAKMRATYIAIIQFHDHTGKYPAQLKDLVPTYLKGPSALHCDKDQDTDPSHSTFTYYRPSENAAGTTQILSSHLTYVLNQGDKKQTVDDTIVTSLDGTMKTSVTKTDDSSFYHEHSSTSTSTQISVPPATPESSRGVSKRGIRGIRIPSTAT